MTLASSSKHKIKAVAGTAAGAALVLGSFGSAYAAPTADAPEAPAQNAISTMVSGVLSISQQVTSDTVDGQFQATQAQTASVGYLADTFKKVSATLCNSGTHEEQASADFEGDALDWEFSVSGAVKRPFTAAVGAFVSDEADGSQTTVMGCACVANPAGGLAVANAEVTGIDLQQVLMHAGLDEDANAVKFTSADGYTQTIPLYYLYTHSSLIAYEVGGEPVSESMGGTVQVWFDGAAASYYVADVKDIEVLALDETPAAPGENDEFANSPNVTVLSAE
ncbi:MAG: molybdopterin-dependent oxidoreductase [Adlercreutzia sp.]|nr:molybdopterin-dependent oxidoreductase [Adlercreutzia sp.]